MGRRLEAVHLPDAVRHGLLHRDGRPSAWPTTRPSTPIVRPIRHRPELYREAERLVAQHRREYWIVGVTVTTIFETAWALRGLSRLMMDFVDRSGPGPAHPRHSLPLSPGGRQPPGGDGRGHDLDRRRRRQPAGDDDLAGHVADVPQAAHGRVHRRAEGDQSGGQGRLPLATATCGRSFPN